MSFHKKSRKKTSKKSDGSRDVIKSSPHRITGGGHIEGLTLDGNALHESPNERNAIPFLTLCRDVLSLSSQKTEYLESANGKTTENTPDFTVNTTFSGCLRLELKSLASLMRDSNIEKAVAIGNLYRQHDIPFAFLVDAQIMQEPQFSNVKLLGRYITSTPPPEVIESATTVLAEGALPIRGVMQQTELKLVDIYVLIARRHLCIDMLVSLSTESSISLPDQPHKGLSLENTLNSTRFGHLLERLALGRRPKDKQLVAAAKDWRRPNRPLGVFNFVGGL